MRIAGSQRRCAQQPTLGRLGWRWPQRPRGVSGDPTSDPMLADTNGDGFTDGFEVAQNADPNNAASLPADRFGEPTQV